MKRLTLPYYFPQVHNPTILKTDCNQETFHKAPDQSLRKQRWAGNHCNQDKSKEFWLLNAVGDLGKNPGTEKEH